MKYVYDDLCDVNSNLKYKHYFEETGGHGFIDYHCKRCGIYVEFNFDCKFGDKIIFYDKFSNSIKAPECIKDEVVEDINSLIEI